MLGTKYFHLKKNICRIFYSGYYFRITYVQISNNSITFQQLDGYVPGQDYPIYSEVPQGLSFRCDQRPPGYYSDPEAQCQVNTYITVVIFQKISIGHFNIILRIYY